MQCSTEIISNEIINRLFNQFLTHDGFISRDYPSKGRVIFDNLDDVAPFLIYYGKVDRLIQQLHRIDFDGLMDALKQNGVIYPHRIDECVGGLAAIFRASNDQIVKKLLDQLMDWSRNSLFTDNNLLGATSLNGHTRDFRFISWGGSFLETLLEIRDLYPWTTERVVTVMTQWLNHPFVKKTGMFPFAGSPLAILDTKDKILAFLGRPMKEHPGIAEGTHRSRFGVMLRNLRRTLTTSGEWVLQMKGNSGPAFCLIALYEAWPNKLWTESLRRWVDQVFASLETPEGIAFSLLPNGQPTPPQVTSGFITIDVVVEGWRAGLLPEDDMQRAGTIANHMLKWQRPDGLYPEHPNSELAHIDNQVDFAISLRRLGEATGNQLYTKEGVELLGRTIELFHTDEGYCTYLDLKGKPFKKFGSSLIDPKYNALLLKGVIALETQNQPLSDNPYLLDLFKDR